MAEKPSVGSSMITFGDSGARALDPGVLRLWRRSALTLIIPISVIFVVATLALRSELAWWGVVALGVWFAICAFWWISLPIAYRRYRYRFGHEALEIEKGAWWRSITAIPYDRIQAVDLEQGPWQRKAGITELRLRTAAIANATLPGIPVEESEAIRTAILDRAGRSDGV